MKQHHDPPVIRAIASATGILTLYSLGSTLLSFYAKFYTPAMPAWWNLRALQRAGLLRAPRFSPAGGALSEPRSRNPDDIPERTRSCENPVPCHAWWVWRMIFAGGPRTAAVPPQLSRHQYPTLKMLQDNQEHRQFCFAASCKKLSLGWIGFRRSMG